MREFSGKGLKRSVEPFEEDA